MLSLDDFTVLTLEDRSLFNQLYQRYPPVHSDNVFTTMISWMAYGDYHYVHVKDNLVIMSRINGEIRLRPPMGSPNRDLLRDVLELAKKEGATYPFGVIDEQTKTWIVQMYPTIKFQEHRDYFDYVYRSSDLAELPGSKYGKIRNRLNKFINNYSYTTEAISEENMKEIQEFLQRWCLWKDCDSDIILENEKKAILYSIKHFFDLKLSGIAIRINDQIEAIAVYEHMNPNTAVVHYEKGSPDYDGIYKAINMETAKILQHQVSFIDREEDMGIPGLRQAKLAYRPHHLVKVFHVKKEDIHI